MNTTMNTEREIMEHHVPEINAAKDHDRRVNPGSGFSVTAEKLKLKRLDEKFARLTADEKAEMLSLEEHGTMEPVSEFWQYDLGLSWSECKARYWDNQK